jgi:4-hydroxy-2-oxoheptanedioate aldolase
LAKRINKAIELLEMGQPVYMTNPGELTYENGLKQAKTWADVLLMDFEHHFFNIGGLGEFMKGLRDGGPTASGHATPTVMATVPSNCITVDEVRANAWQMRHVLSTGAHGVLHTHARDPEAVKWFVAACRYPFQELGRDELPEGIRGSGGQKEPSEIWGVSTAEYEKLADPWPLNPKGELLLGLKIEDRHCLPNVDRTAAVPGIGMAEWGPGDMGMSLNLPDAHDPPYPPEMDDARNKVKNALDANGVAFYSGWNDDTMTEEQRVDYMLNTLGSRMIGSPDRETADIGRKMTGRTMPV